MTTIPEETAQDVGGRTLAPKKFRVQLDFEANDFTTINELVDELHLGTRAELFRSGLRALRWMWLKKKQGCTIVAITPDQRYIEPEFDFLGESPSPSQFRSSRASVKAEEAEPVHA